MTTQAREIAVDHARRISTGDIAGAAALMTDDCVLHAAIPEAQGRDGFVRTMTKLREAFPDLSFTVEDAFADGDRAVLRLTFAGTHRGPLAFARLPLAPTGKAVRMEQIHIVRVAGGKIVEHWMAQDSIGLFRQLGLQVTPAA